jgi:hypothetical protein
MRNRGGEVNALTAVGFADVFVEEHRVGRTREFLIRGKP